MTAAPIRCMIRPAHNLHNGCDIPAGAAVFASHLLIDRDDVWNIANCMVLCAYNRNDTPPDNLLTGTAQSIREAIEHKVSGMIVALNENPDDAFAALAASHIPFATIETYSPQLDAKRENAVHVKIDNAETFGMVYLEAMSQGVPVLYTRGQGFDGQFPDGQVGYPVICRNISSQADALHRIAEEDYEAMSSRCLEAAGSLSLPRVAGMWMQLYGE